MGVLGVCIIYAIYSFFMMIRALAKYNAWKKMAVPCDVTVMGISNQIPNYKGKKNSVYYQYALSVLFRSQMVQGFYEETVILPNGTPRFTPGAQANLLYDPRNGSTRDAKLLKGDIKTHAITMVASIAIGIACVVLVSLISG